MGCSYSVYGTLKVKPGQAEAAVEFLQAEGCWPLEQAELVIDMDRVRIDLGDSMSYSTAVMVDEKLQEAAVRFGEGASVFTTECDGEHAELVVGADEQDRRAALVALLDEKIEALSLRRERVLTGLEEVRNVRLP